MWPVGSWCSRGRGQLEVQGGLGRVFHCASVLGGGQGSWKKSKQLQLGKYTQKWHNNYFKFFHILFSLLSLLNNTIQSFLLSPLSPWESCSNRWLRSAPSVLAKKNTIMSLYMFQSPQTGVLYKQCNKQLAPIVSLVCQNLLSEEIRPTSPMLLTINQKNRLQSHFSEEIRD